MLLRPMKYLVAIVDCDSFTEAAEREFYEETLGIGREYLFAVSRRRDRAHLLRVLADEENELLHRRICRSPAKAVRRLKDRRRSPRRLFSWIRNTDR